MAPASYGPGPTYGHAGPAFGTGGPAFHQPHSVMSQLDTLRHRQNGHGHLLEDVQRTGHGTQQAVESLRNGLQNMHSLLVNTNTDVANLRNSQAPLNAAVHEIQLALGRLENKFDALRDRMGDGAGGSAKRQRSEEDKSIAGLKTLGFCTKCAREDVSRKWNTCRDHNPKFAA